MRAVVIREFGPPRVLLPTHMPDPAVGPGQALIEVQVANVTFVETQVRAGRPPHPAMLPSLPAILGNGVAGVVADVGAGVDTSWLGRRVIASLRGTGGYAERAIASADQLVAIPPELGTQEAVALLADGRTALLLVQAAAIQPGEVVLVEALRRRMLLTGLGGVCPGPGRRLVGSRLSRWVM